MSTENQDPEVSAMSSVSNALADLDNEARSRVIEWATKKFGIATSKKLHTETPDTAKSKLPEKPQDSNEAVSELLEYNEEDGFTFHFRDVKAKSALDAVNRLLHIAIYAYEKLTGNKEIPRSVITNVLDEWRVNDGNARSYITKHAGIKKKGSGASATLFLDRPGKLEAETFLAEISNPEITGKWNPSKKTVRKKSSKKDDTN